MTIWYVDGLEDLNCAWTKKADAIKYLKEEAKRCEWKLISKEGREEKNDAMYYVFSWDCYRSKNNEFSAYIRPIFLDEKPYIDVGF